MASIHRVDFRRPAPRLVAVEHPRLDALLRLWALAGVGVWLGLPMWHAAMHVAGLGYWLIGAPLATLVLLHRHWPLDCIAAWSRSRFAPMPASASRVQRRIRPQSSAVAGWRRAA